MRARRAAAGAPSPTPRHATKDEYAPFLASLPLTAVSVQHRLDARRRFVGRYPDLRDWFAAPLAVRVGWVREDGRRVEPRSGYVERDAKSYLCFLAASGLAPLDREYLLASRTLVVSDHLRRAGLLDFVEEMVAKAVALGYQTPSARQSFRWSIARIFLNDPTVAEGGITEAHVAGFEEAVRAFGERDDVGLFYGSAERYYRTGGHFYRAHLHKLRVALYHLGRIDREPKRDDAKPRVLVSGVGKPAMEAVAQRYVDARGLTDRPNTVHQTAQQLRALIRWLSRAHPEMESLAQLEREHLTQFARDMEQEVSSHTGQVLSLSTRRANLVGVAAFLRNASRWGWEGVPERPLLGPGDFPRKPERVPRFIPEGELARLMEAIRNLECPYQRAALLIARWSGARRDEIVRLEVDCLDAYPDGTPRLRIPAGKNYRERVVPITEEAADAIRHLRTLRSPEERGFRDDLTGTEVRRLFVHRGKPFSAHYLCERSLRKACATAGLVDGDGKHTVWVHRFRHTVGTQLAEKGARLPTIMKVLGHQSVNMSMLYSRIGDKTVLEDYRKVLEAGATVAGPLAETLRHGELPEADVEWLKRNFFKTELELGHCLRLPQEGPCECDLYLSCPKFVTTKEYAPRLRTRREKEFLLIEEAASNGWEREIERHRCTVGRIENLLGELGEAIEG